MGVSARMDSSNLNGRFSLMLTRAMDSFVLRAILHRDYLFSYTLSKIHSAENRLETPKTRACNALAASDHPLSCLATLALPPASDDIDVPQLSAFAYSVLQNEILALISDNDRLQRTLKSLNTCLPQSSASSNPDVFSASVLEKLVERKLSLLNSPMVVAFSIKCTNSIKVCRVLVIAGRHIPLIVFTCRLHESAFTVLNM
jgi:hypothetical protein